MSAQFLRYWMSGKSLSPRMPGHHRGEPLGIGLHGADVHAFAGELPLEVTAVVFRTPVIAPTRRPSRDVPMAMFMGLPPTDLVKVMACSSGTPKFAAVRSTHDTGRYNQVKVLF